MNFLKLYLVIVGYFFFLVVVNILKSFLCLEVFYLVQECDIFWKVYYLLFNLNDDLFISLCNFDCQVFGVLYCFFLLMDIICYDLMIFVRWENLCYVGYLVVVVKQFEDLVRVYYYRDDVCIGVDVYV